MTNLFRILWDNVCCSARPYGINSCRFKYRQFEERMRTLMIELESSRDVIVSTDELYTLVGQVSHWILMLRICSNLFVVDIQIVGATTLMNIENTFGKDGALERRFQK